VGALADRLVRAMFLGGVNRLAGAAFGAAKGAVLLGFGLLLAEHSLPSTSLGAVIARSRLGRPLEQLAGSVVERGRGLRTVPAEHAA
jgi:membrane protein required for colicin V production